jgi:hypothetical protein
MNEVKNIEEVVSGVLGNYPYLLGMVTHYNDLVNGNVLGVRKVRVIVFGDEEDPIVLGATSVKNALEQKGFSVGEVSKTDSGASLRCSLIPVIKTETLVEQNVATQSSPVDQIAMPMGSSGNLL